MSWYIVTLARCGADGALEELETVLSLDGPSAELVHRAGLLRAAAERGAPVVPVRDRWHLHAWCEATAEQAQAFDPEAYAELGRAGKLWP